MLIAIPQAFLIDRQDGDENIRGRCTVRVNVSAFLDAPRLRDAPTCLLIRLQKSWGTEVLFFVLLSSIP
jgi:hypothetical protein